MAICRGFDLGVVDKDGDTLLHVAARNCQLGAVMMLLKYGAYPLILNKARAQRPLLIPLLSVSSPPSAPVSRPVHAFFLSICPSRHTAGRAQPGCRCAPG